MKILVSGGCKNGKSSLAQDLAYETAKKLGLPPVYFATMIPHDSEDDERIKKHREDRKNLGFETIECCKNIGEAVKTMEEGRAVLFDSLTALVANEMFSDDFILNSFQNLVSNEEKITQKIQNELEILMNRSDSVIFVSDTIFNDGKIYDGTTELYRKILAKVENFVAGKCDKVVEMVNKSAITNEFSNKKNDTSSLISDFSLIIGGAYQGKTAWAKEKFSLSDEDICVCTDDKLPDLSKKCISHYENYAAYCLKNEIEIKTDFSDCETKIIICDDIFCGVVPVDSFQRKLREQTGLALQKIAKNAIVTRLFCGIARRIN